MLALCLGTTLPSSSEICACSSGMYSSSRCFPVMSSGCTASKVYNCSKRITLGMVILDDSSSVHGSDYENDEISPVEQAAGLLGAGSTF